jgi:hypothetical protein
VAGQTQQVRAVRARFEAALRARGDGLRVAGAGLAWWSVARFVRSDAASLRRWRARPDAERERSTAGGICHLLRLPAALLMLLGAALGSALWVGGLVLPVFNAVAVASFAAMWLLPRFVWVLDGRRSGLLLSRVGAPDGRAWYEVASYWAWPLGQGCGRWLRREVMAAADEHGVVLVLRAVNRTAAEKVYLPAGFVFLPGEQGAPRPRMMREPRGHDPRGSDSSTGYVQSSPQPGQTRTVPSPSQTPSLPS